MAVENLDFLSLVQEVFKEIRETPPTSIETPSTRAKQVIQAIKNVYLEVCSLNNGHLSFLEEDGTITLATGTREYSLAADIKDPNLEGWILDNTKELKYLDYNAFVEKYPDATDEGVPYEFTIWGGQAIIGYVPDLNFNGKTVVYKYWKQPDDLSAGTDVPLIPKEFRRRVLVFGAAAHILQTDGDPSYKMFWDRYLGGVQDLKRGYCSIVPTKARVTHIF